MAKSFITDEGLKVVEAKMMKRVSGILVCILLMITAVLPLEGASMAEEIIDQHQEESDDCLWFYPSEWQEFVPSHKRLVRVEVKIMQGYGGSPPLTLSVERPLGTVITSRELPVSSIPNTCDWVSFDVSDVSLETGKTHYLKLSYPPGGEYAWAGASGNPYPQGSSSKGGGWDWCFRTYVEVCRPEVEVVKGLHAGVSAVVTNNECPDLTNVRWTISVEGGFILLGEYASGVISSIPPGDTATISSRPVLGLGRAVITVTVGDCDPVTANAIVLGPFVLVQ